MKFKLLSSTIVIQLTLLLPQSVVGQFISNMSFEGAPQENVAPPDWSPCRQFSTPDTQPGFWEVTTSPSDGNSYVGLVTRGNLGPYANHNEDIQTRLINPLLVGEEYAFNLDLSISETWGHFIDFGSTFLSYYNPCKLQIFGGSASCEQLELLWESPAVDHPDWKSYAVSLKPEISDVHYLILQAGHVGGSTYFGNILIDNFVECSFALAWVSDTTICAHEPLILNVAVPNGSYEWQDGSTNPVYTISSAGMYSVTISNGCVSDSFEINVQTRNCFCDAAVPIETTPFDSLICAGESLMLDAQTPGGIYLWSDGSTTAAITVSQPGIYTVEVTNKCETENFEFRVRDKECNCEISAPNVFTPNGDGVNETFEISGTSDIARFRISVFDRSGNQVYQSDNLGEFWDGSINGHEASSGVYYWVIELMCIQGQSILDNSFTGWVTVIR